MKNGNQSKPHSGIIWGEVKNSMCSSYPIKKTLLSNHIHVLAVFTPLTNSLVAGWITVQNSNYIASVGYLHGADKF